MDLLSPALFGAVHAGRELEDRKAPVFRCKDPAPTGVVLVDDVLTTGLTLETAMSVLGGSVVDAVTATVRL